MAFFDKLNPDQARLFKTNIQTPFLQEIFEQNTFSPFIRSDSSGVIYTIANDLTHKGQVVVIPMMRYGDVQEVYDENTLEGKGKSNLPVSEYISVGLIRYAVGASDIKLAEIQTDMKIPSQLKTDLHMMGKNFETRRLVNQFARCFFKQNETNDYKTYSYYLRYEGENKSEFEREAIPKILNCKIDSDMDAISSDRLVICNYKIKNVDKGKSIENILKLDNTNQNLGPNDPTKLNTSTMSLRHIDKLLQIANTGSNIRPNSEQIILPYKSSENSGFKNRNFVLFAAPSVIQKLTESSVWKEQTARGIIETKDQPSIFYNSYYYGSIRNVDIVGVPEFEHMSLNVDNKQFGYAALCGKSAIGYVTGTKPEFTTQKFDHGHKLELGFTVISGAKPLKFTPKNPNNIARVERGIVHSWTQIA